MRRRRRTSGQGTDDDVGRALAGLDAPALRTLFAETIRRTRRAGLHPRGPTPRRARRASLRRLDAPARRQRGRRRRPRLRQGGVPRRLHRRRARGRPPRACVERLPPPRLRRCALHLWCAAAGDPRPRDRPRAAEARRRGPRHRPPRLLYAVRGGRVPDEHPAERPLAVFDAIREVEGLAYFHRPLAEMEHEAVEPLPDFEGFVEGWRTLLEPEVADERSYGWSGDRRTWLQEATERAEGAAGLAEMARASGRAEDYRAWCRALAGAGDFEGAMRAFDEAAGAVETPSQRAWFLDDAARCAHRLGRRDVPARLERAWRADPDLVRLRRWLGTSDARETIRRRIRAAREACPHEHANQHAVLAVLAGDLPAAARRLAAAPGLGWSDPEHPGREVFMLFLELLGGPPHEPVTRRFPGGAAILARMIDDDEYDRTDDDSDEDDEDADSTRARGSKRRAPPRSSRARACPPWPTRRPCERSWVPCRRRPSAASTGSWRGSAAATTTPRLRSWPPWSRATHRLRRDAGPRPCGRRMAAIRHSNAPSTSTPSDRAGRTGGQPPPEPCVGYHHFTRRSKVWRCPSWCSPRPKPL